MKKLFSLIALIVSLCCVSLAFSASLQESRRAAERGDAVAQLQLGFAYATGQGVPQDFQKARYWWEKSAAQGNPEAQVNLGIMYVVAHGVPQNFHKAKQWYEKAARQGNAQAQFNLGVMYERGQGVRQNLATAKEWYGKACDNGFQDGCRDYARLNGSRY